MQSILVIILVAACAVWLMYMACGHFRPKPGGRLCAGGCCDGEAKKPAAAPGRRTLMVSAADLRNRVQARK